jgi:hypothetical protein
MNIAIWANSDFFPDRSCIFRLSRMNDNEDISCLSCNECLPSFWFTNPHRCVVCVYGKRACATCREILLPANFSQTQLSRGIESKCRDCTVEPSRDEGSRRECWSCREKLPSDMFSRSQISRHGFRAHCKNCTEPSVPKKIKEEVACVACKKRQHQAEFTLEANGTLCRRCFYNTSFISLSDKSIGEMLARQLRHEEALRAVFPLHKFENVTKTTVAPTGRDRLFTCAMCAVSSDDFPEKEREFDNPRCRPCIRKLCPIDVAKISVVHFQDVMHDPALLAFAVNAMLRDAGRLEKRGMMFGIVHK